MQTNKKATKMIQKSIYATAMTIGLLLAANESDIFIWNIAGTVLFLAAAKALGILDRALEPENDSTAGATKTKQAEPGTKEKGGKA